MADEIRGDGGTAAEHAILVEHYARLGAQLVTRKNEMHEVAIDARERARRTIIRSGTQKEEARLSSDLAIAADDGLRRLYARAAKAGVGENELDEMVDAILFEWAHRAGLVAQALRPHLYKPPLLHW